MFASRKFVAPALASLLAGASLLVALASGQAVAVSAEDTHWGTAGDCPADTHWSVDLNACVPNNDF
ncbi:hypothetical protein [Umezawaea sp. NPDC059074]|uniref:hypothetical protein n=1 Tax=Umezawaea sp. NPDC059074 TaxID=3346716 RepID=UPI00369EA9D1